MQHLVESGKIYQLLEPQDGPNAGDEDGNFYVDMSGAHTCFVVFNIDEGDNQDYTLTIRETDGTTPQDLDSDVPIWQNDDATDSSNDLEREDDGEEIEITGSTDEKVVVFQVDSSKLDLDDGYHSITARVTSAGDASNHTIGAMAYILPARYKEGRDDA